MSKRKRELTQRLEDLFSTPADGAPHEEPPLASDSGLALLVQTLAAHAEPTFLATLFDRLPLPLYIKDRDHKWVAANPAFCQIIHHQASQLIGRTDKEQDDEEWQHDDHVLETGQPEESEINFTDDLGLVKRRPISRLPVLDRDGQAQFVVGFMPAVSEPKAIDAADVAEEVFKRNRELAAINQISQALAAHTDLRTSIRKVGDIIRRLFNVSEAYIALYDRAANMLELPFFIERNLPDDIPPIPLGQGLSSIVIQTRQPLLLNQDTERRARELGAIITGKQAQSYLGVPILAGDEAIGVISIQSVETSGLFNQDDVQLLTTVAVNIGSAIRNAQLFEKAQQAEQRFRVIADTTPFPILISRATDDLVLYANERVGPMFGVAKDELIGQISPDFYFEPLDREKIMKYVRRDGRLINYEVRVKKIDGTPFWTLVSLEPMIFNGESAIVSSFYDITERKLIEGQVLQRNMQLAVLNRISQRLSHLAEPTEICELIYEEMGQILNNENLYIALYDKATNIISFPVYTIGGERRLNPSRPFGKALTEHIIRTKEPLLIARNAAAEIAKLGIASSGQPAQSWMGAPLMVGQEAIGVIAVQNYKEPDAFRPDQLEVLITVASQAAIALENSRLFAQTQQELIERKQAEQAIQKRAEQLASLNRVGRQLVELKPIDEILETIYQSVGEVIDHRNFYIALYDEPNRQIHYPVYSFDNVRAEPHSRAYGKALTEHVLETKQPLFIPHDVVGFLAQIGIESVGRPAQCWMGVPLLVGNRAIGVITLQDYEKPDVYTLADVELLTLIASQAAIALENARLFAQTQARIDELAALNEIGRAASGQVDVRELLEVTYRKIASVMRADGFFVGLYDPDRQMIAYPLCYDGGEIFNEPDSAMDPETHSYQVITSGQPLFIEYTEEERAVVFSRPETMIGDKEGLPASVIFAPLKAGDQILGVISVQSYEAGKHTPENLNLLVSIANQVAVSLENARLFNEGQRLVKVTEQRNAELAIINSVQAELSAALAAELNIQSIYDAVGDKIREIFDAQVVDIGLYDRSDNLLHFPYTIERGVRFPDEPTHLIGFRKQVIESRQPLLINQDVAAARAQYEQPIPIQGEAAKSILYAPMIVGGEAKGVISLQNLDRENAFSEPDMRLLQTLANAMSVALENARLFDETQRLLKETEQSNAELAIINSVQADLAAALATELDIHSIYDLVGDKIRDIFHQSSMAIRIYDPETNIVQYPYVYENGQRISLESRPLPEKGFGPHVIRTRETLVVNENVIQASEEYGSYTLPGTQVEKSLVMVPLIAGGQARGLIHLVDNEHEHAFSDSAVRLLTTLANSMSVALENARLFEQTRNARAAAESRLRESQILQAFGQTVSSSLDVDRVLDAFMQVLEQQMGFTFIAIALIDREAGLLRTARAIGATTMQGLARPLESVQNDITMDIANKGQIEVIDGWDDRFDRTIYEREGHAQLVRAFVPLTLRGQSMGIIETGYLREKRAHILPEEIRVLQSLANSMSVALENARLFEQSRSRAAELTVLNEVAQRLSTRLSVNQVLDETYQGIRRLMDAENFYIGLYDEAKHQISFLLNVTESVTDRQIVVISADEGMSGYIVRNRTSVLVGDGIDSWAEKMGIQTVGQNALSWLGVPMIVGNQVLGVMAIQNYLKPNAYHDHDRELLFVFANQTGIAIQNALLFERTENDSLRERTINLISGKIRNAQSVEQILHIATEELRLATRTDRSAAQISVAPDQASTPTGNGDKG
jgi:PAS domain S-box-containing protein